MSSETPHRLKIAFTPDGQGVNLWSNDRTLYFSRAMWNELLCMAATMEALDRQVMANFEEPERPDWHEVTVFPEAPRKFDIGDLA